MLVTPPLTGPNLSPNLMVLCNTQIPMIPIDTARRVLERNHPEVRFHCSGTGVILLVTSLIFFVYAIVNANESHVAVRNGCQANLVINCILMSLKIYCSSYNTGTSINNMLYENVRVFVVSFHSKIQIVGLDSRIELEFKIIHE